jgi:hypothetical protein
MKNVPLEAVGGYGENGGQALKSGRQQQREGGPPSKRAAQVWKSGLPDFLDTVDQNAGKIYQIATT